MSLVNINPRHSDIKNLIKNNEKKTLAALGRFGHLAPDIPLDANGNYIPHYAAMYGNLECIRMLEENGHSLNQISEMKRNPLHTSIMFNQHHITQYLTEQKEVKRGNRIEMVDRIDINQSDDEGNTPLHICAQTNNVFALECLMSSNKVQLDIINNKGRSFVQEAIECNSIDIIEQLTYSSKSLELLRNSYKNFDDKFKLQLYSSQKYLPVKDLFDKYGLIQSNSEIIESQDKTLISEYIYQCIDNGHLEDINKIMEISNFDIETLKDSNDLNPIQACVSKNKLKELKSIIKQFNILNLLINLKDSKTENGFSLIHLAASNSSIEMFEFIIFHLKTKENIYLIPEYVRECKTNNGSNILHIAADNGNVEIINYILKHDIIDPNQCNDEGMTPLFMASEMGHENVVKLLIEAGGDWEIQDSQGRDSSDIAKLRGYDNIVEIISDYSHADTLEYVENAIRL